MDRFEYDDMTKIATYYGIVSIISVSGMEFKDAHNLSRFIYAELAEQDRVSTEKETDRIMKAIKRKG